MWAFLVAPTDDVGVRETVEAAVAEQDQIMLALIALVGTSIAALVFVIRNGRYAKSAGQDAATAAQQATAANNAVNNVGPGKSTLYDMVERIRDNMFAVKDDVHDLKVGKVENDKHEWDQLPADLATAAGLTTAIRELQSGHVETHRKLDTIIDYLREAGLDQHGIN